MTKIPNTSPKSPTNFLQEATSTNYLTLPLPKQLVINHSTDSYVQKQLVYTPPSQTKDHCLQ